METRLLIDGELVEGQGAQLVVENPFNEGVVATPNESSLGQTEAAIAAARQAAKGWEATPAVERCDLLHDS